MIPESTRHFLTRLARNSPEREICGFILRDWTVWTSRNVAGSDSEFEIDHEETILAYENRYDDLTGVYHSHPSGDPHPSPKDIQHAPPGFRYFIVTTEKVYEWEFDGQGSANLVDPVLDATADS